MRKAVEDEMQALLSDPALSVDEAAARAQKNANEILLPYAKETALKF